MNLTGYPSIDKPWLKYYSEEAIHAPLPDGSMYDYMTACNAGRLDEPALNYFGRKITHRKLQAEIDRCARALTACGVYDNIAKYAGAGTLVPITGFANSMVSPALEFKSEGFVTGLGAKLFTVAGPVLVFGISASVLYGIVLYIIGLF